MRKLTYLQRYNNRLKLVTTTISVKESENAEDLDVWRWLKELILLLNVDGMSSDESDEEGDIYITYRKKKLPWRRNMDKLLTNLDKLRLTDKEIWANQGSKPIPRRASELVSTRGAVTNLPRQLYDDRWFNSLTESEKKQLDVAQEPYTWYDVTLE